ncbi:MAG TPA: CoA-transferase [Solirubrobacteraceae bacterium]|nr:CoA-transferase [Solirubrobacteraceae bacterium]
MSEQRDGAPTPEETMTIVAAREVRDRQVLLVGVGPPNAAANLARRLHAPDCVLVYESGAIEAKPVRLPLSIGDDDLAETAAELVSVPEMLNYWVGAGRIDVGFLGAAQIDRFCNINTTVIGAYDDPKVRLPGAGGAPEIAAASREVIVVVRQSKRSFVEKLDFVTSIGHGDGSGTRERLNFSGAGPTVVITDLGVLRPGPDGELELAAIHPGVDVEQVRESTGWPLRVRDVVEATEPPSERELHTLREMRAAVRSAA